MFSSAPHVQMLYWNGDALAQASGMNAGSTCTNVLLKSTTSSLKIWVRIAPHVQMLYWNKAEPIDPNALEKLHMYKCCIEILLYSLVLFVCLCSTCTNVVLK